MANNPYSVPVALTQPTDYAAQLAELERRRQYAALLSQQSIEPLQQLSVGGVAGRNSWTQVLAKLLQGGLGGYERGQVEKGQKDVAQQYQQDLQNTINQASGAIQGAPAKPEEVLPQDVQGPPQPATPAIPSNPELAAAILMRHPETRNIGAAQLNQSLNDLRASEFLKRLGVNTGQSGNAPIGQSQSGTGAEGPVSTQSQSGLMVNPLAAALSMSSDPRLQALGKAQETRSLEEGKPVVNRGYGIGTMRGGRFFPDPLSLSQALDVEKGKAQINQPYESPVSLKTSTGREIQLSRPEWNVYQTTGILPVRITGEIPQSIPPQEVPAYSQVRSADVMGIPMTQSAPRQQGIGQIGVTQSQQDQIQQAQQQATATKMGGQLGEQGANIYAEGALAAGQFQKLVAMENMATNFEPSKLAPMKQWLGEWAIGLGVMTPEQADQQFGSIGNMQALTAATTRLAAEALRKADAQPALKQLEMYLNAMPNKGQTKEGFALTMQFLQAAEKMKIAKMQGAQKWFTTPGHEQDVQGFENQWSNVLPQMQTQLFGQIRPNVQENMIPSSSILGAPPAGAVRRIK